MAAGVALRMSTRNVRSVRNETRLVLAHGPPDQLASGHRLVVAPALPLPMEYGVDIGSAVSIQALRARWAGIRSAHPQLFDGLAPTIALGETQQSNRPELRLVIGPIASANAAAKLCKTLEHFRLTCQPTIFAGRHLALD